MNPTLPSDQDASGRSFGPEELELLRTVLESGTLFAPKGAQTRHLAQEFAALIGTRHAVVCSSGSAAIHTAVAALDPEPGDEIVTTSVTDMGALTPILYQGAIPVFADVDSDTGCVTADTIADRLSERTRAIVVTHLFGSPCAMDPILELAGRRGLPVIEDCAQAYLAESRGRRVGSLGTLGAFSLQQGKHITTGEGGFVVTQDDALARRSRLFVDKAWPYGESGPNLDHEFIALNYRVSELQSAVARAQIAKLPGGVAQRIAMAERLAKRLADIPGVATPRVEPGDRHSYWRYPLLIDAEQVPGGPTALAGALKAFEIPSAPRYIAKPAFRCAVFAEQRTFGKSRWPFTTARPEALDYRAERFPGTYSFLERVLVLPWNERLEEAHIDRLASAIASAVEGLRA